MYLVMECQQNKHSSSLWYVRLLCTKYTLRVVFVCVQAAVQEEQMRMYVHCCLTLSMVWVPSLSAINTLWDFFSKNLVCHKSFLSVSSTFFSLCFLFLFLIVFVGMSAEWIVLSAVVRCVWIGQHWLHPTGSFGTSQELL